MDIREVFRNGRHISVTWWHPSQVPWLVPNIDELRAPIDWSFIGVTLSHPDRTQSRCR